MYNKWSITWGTKNSGMWLSSQYPSWHLRTVESSNHKRWMGKRMKHRNWCFLPELCEWLWPGCLDIPTGAPAPMPFSSQEVGGGGGRVQAVSICIRCPLRSRMDSLCIWLEAWDPWSMGGGDSTACLALCWMFTYSLGVWGSRARGGTMVLLK